MIKRKFILGDEWLYYKIYCGTHVADIVLKETIIPLANKLLKDKIITQWFFIRYSDPDFHLRIRFKLNKIEFLNKVIFKCKEMFLPYVKDNLIYNIQIDTYNRELERYGISTMELSEQIFFYDSELVVKAMSIIKDEQTYFLFILKSIDSFLNQFNLNELEKLNFYNKNFLEFKSEFKIKKVTKLSLDKKYRNIKTELNNIMSIDNFIPLVNILEERNLRISPLVSKILTERKLENLKVSIPNLLMNYIHMFVNRAFRNKQRFHEMIAYDFLGRYQLSNIKKNED